MTLSRIAPRVRAHLLPAHGLQLQLAVPVLGLLLVVLHLLLGLAHLLLEDVEHIVALRRHGEGCCASDRLAREPLLLRQAECGLLQSQANSDITS
jgi:hypothetical protein